jgi:hypothetical protein
VASTGCLAIPRRDAGRSITIANVVTATTSNITPNIAASSIGPLQLNPRESLQLAGVVNQANELMNPATSHHQHVG